MKKLKLLPLNADCHGERSRTTLTTLVATSLVSVGGWAKVNPAEVILLKAEVNYTQIFRNDGESFLVAMPLKELERRLKSYAFLRPHKSFLVNRSYILNVFNVEEKDAFVQLSNDAKVNISRRKKADFLLKLET